MKDNKEILDLAEMFDTIINSDNPAVQRSLQYTVVLAKLAEERQNMEGPFHRMIRNLEQLKEEIRQLKRSVQILENQNATINPVHDTTTTDLFKYNISVLTTDQIHAMVQPLDLYALGTPSASTINPLNALGTPSASTINPLSIINPFSTNTAANSAESGY
jgi:U3 small nucleolar RNA-associated protein 14